MVQPHDDPGWFTATDLLLSFVPIVGMRSALSGDRNFLQLLRLVFVTFAQAIVLIGIVAAYLAGDAGSDSMSPPLAAGMVVRSA